MYWNYASNQLPDEGRLVLAVKEDQAFIKYYSDGKFFNGDYSMFGPRGVMSPDYWTYINLPKKDDGKDTLKDLCAV